MERSNSGLAILILFLFVASYLFPFYPETGTKHELTYWLTAVSLVEEGTFDISKAASEIGPAKPVDTEQIGEGIYSVRPPGFALLAAPFYALTRIIMGDPSKENQRTSWFVLKLLLGTAPLFLLAGWLYGREVDSYSLAVLLFATPMLGYGLLLYPHVVVAVVVYLAFRILFDGRDASPETCFSASFLLGLGLLFDYLILIPIVIFAVGTLSMERRERVRRFLFYFAGLVPGIMGLGIYSSFVFGNPAEVLMFGHFGIPSATSVYQSLVSPSQGVFVFAPVLILGFLGIMTSNESGTRRNKIKGWTIVVYIILASGTALEFGGDSIGPRHMILIMPLLLDSFFDGDIEEYPSHWRGLMLVVSIAFCVLPLLTYPFVSDQLQFPHNSFWGPLLLQGGVYGTTVPNTFGYLSSYWTITPIIAAVVLVVFSVWRDSKYPTKFGAGILIGIGVVAAYLFAYPLETEKGRELRREITTVEKMR